MKRLQWRLRNLLIISAVAGVTAGFLLREPLAFARLLAVVLLVLGAVQVLRPASWRGVSLAWAICFPDWVRRRQESPSVTLPRRSWTRRHARALRGSPPSSAADGSTPKDELAILPAE